MFGYRPLDGGPGYVKMQSTSSSYQDMSRKVVNKRSDYPPGYGGFLHDVKFSYGYGNIGPNEKLTPPRPTSRDPGVQYDTRPGPMYGGAPPSTVTPPTVKTVHWSQLEGPTPSKPSQRRRHPGNFSRTVPAETPFYLRGKKEMTPFPYYRPLSGKNGQVSPGSQYPSHPAPPFICGSQMSEYTAPPTRDEMTIEKKAPMASTMFANTWGSCCTGYRHNSLSQLTRVNWMPMKHNSELFTTTYRSEVDNVANNF